MINDGMVWKRNFVSILVLNPSNSSKLISNYNFIAIESSIGFQPHRQPYLITVCLLFKTKN